MLLFYLHGACVRVPADETAFSARRAQWDLDVIGQWSEPSDSNRHVAWVRDVWSKIEPHAATASYINHISQDDRPEKIRASYGSNYDRLRQLKAIYDPTNLFRSNPNIVPAQVEAPR